ncbi:uncharacterized protein LOC143461857 isoform X2 [Clavelina lepadiformis]|uniref:uncharacterized protein LOC143461857 isoform X2 n=1 Tax=Clavelina lepadiformis TaxID=159417 RepID=UPI0040417479
MFFTSDILVATGGKFSTIWLAAMKKNCLKRRNYDKVDLVETCFDLHSCLPPKPDGRMTTVKGFSLRLSAQLVHGVVIVYNKQLLYLYKDAMVSVQKLRRFHSQLELYPTERLTDRLLDIQMPFRETFLDVDPMYGQLNNSVNSDHEVVPNFVNDFSINGAVDESTYSHQRQNIPSRSVHTVNDIATITLPENLPIVPLEDEEFFHAGDIDSAQYVRNLFEDEHDRMTEISDSNIIYPNITSIQNIATPSTALLTRAPMPERPLKERQTQKMPSESNNSTGQDVETAHRSLALTTTDNHGERQHENTESDPMELESLHEPVIQQTRQFYRSHRNLLIDEATELTSVEMRQMLATPLNTIEEYEQQGKLTQYPILKCSTKSIFGSPCTKYMMHSPTRFISHEPSHQRKIIDVTESLFVQAIHHVEPNALVFFAHREVELFGDNLRRPEDEYEDLSYGDLSENVLMFTSNDTLTTEGSVQAVRGSFRVSTGPREITDGFQLEDRARQQNGSHVEIQSRQKQPLNDETLPAPAETSMPAMRNISATSMGMMRDSGMPSVVERSDTTSELEIVDLDILQLQEPSTSHIFGLLPAEYSLWSKTEDHYQHLEGPLAFSLLAPRGITQRSHATKLFFNVLMLARRGLLLLQQDQGYEEIYLIKKRN